MGSQGGRGVRSLPAVTGHGKQGIQNRRCEGRVRAAQVLRLGVGYVQVNGREAALQGGAEVVQPSGVRVVECADQQEIVRQEAGLRGAVFLTDQRHLRTVAVIEEGQQPPEGFVLMRAVEFVDDQCVPALLFIPEYLSLFTRRSR